MKKLPFKTLLAIIAATVSINSSAQSQKEFAPEWAKKAVWYQVFPERFRNGDIENDPKVEDTIGADPQSPPEAWEKSSWGSDWYEIQPWEKENVNDNIYTTLIRRRYGGDLQGIIDKLEYIKSLGITAIYLNPIFVSPSLHKYDAESYHHVDPNLGPDPEGDRIIIKNENALDAANWKWTKADELALTMIEKAHQLGLKIIFDGVFNHMGYNSFAFKDVRKNQEKSPYKDWFTINSFTNIKAGTTFDYVGWFGHKSLPELREDSLGIVDGPKKYIFNSVSRWMNPKGKGAEYGIDGWRMDVAFCIAHPFWKDIRNHIKAINKEAFITAELVLNTDKVKPYMEGDEFDGEMNYNFAFACSDFFFEKNSRQLPPSVFNKELKELREAYPSGVTYASQNLFGSHDANRIGSHIVNRGIEHYSNWSKYYTASMAVTNFEYKTTKPTEDDIQLQKLFVIMQMTYVGAPMIYYGDEVGMWGANDPDCRKPMIWSDIIYSPEIYNQDGSKRTKPEKVEINKDLQDFYKKLIAIRNNNTPLQTGDFKTLLVDDRKAIFAFERSIENNKIIVCFNNSNKDQSIELPESTVVSYRDLLSGKIYKTKQGKITIPLNTKWAAILKAI